MKYLLKRLLGILIIVWGVLTATFILVHLAPGDPTAIYLRPEIDPVVLDNIRKNFGLDLPLWQQYFKWISEFISGNFGYSFQHHEPVSEIFADAIPNTLRLSLCVLFLQFTIGIPLGILSALKRHSIFDKVVNILLLILYSMPGFWVALIAILVFSLQLGWLPSSQMNSLYPINGFWNSLWDQIRHMILPAAILSLPLVTYTVRFVRSNVTDVLMQPYILTAKAYGLGKWKILSYYVLKNALLPLVTLIGVYLPFLLGGAVIIEYIFAWPGIGKITVDAIFARDIPIILASNFIAAMAVVSGNFLADILNRFVDPRINRPQNTIE